MNAYDIARAAGTDAANRRMRAAGRTSWNRADYNLAARTTNALLPAEPRRISTLSPLAERLAARFEAKLRASHNA